MINYYVFLGHTLVKFYFISNQKKKSFGFKKKKEKKRKEKGYFGKNIMIGRRAEKLLTMD